MLSHNTVIAGDKNGKSMFTIVSAAERELVAGLPNSKPQATVQVVAVWKGRGTPTQFMWRGSSKLVGCKVQLAHARTQPANTPGNGYMAENIASGRSINNGDTLLLTTLAGIQGVPGKMPAAKSKNTIYFTVDKKWYCVPVKQFDKKQTIMMP